MKKIIQYIVLLFIIGLGFTSCGGNIAKVKNAVSVFDEGRTLGVAMDNNPYLKDGKYSTYKSTTGYDIVKYEKVFTSATAFDEVYPRYDEEGFPYGTALLSAENEQEPGVYNFVLYMNFFGPESSEGPGHIVIPEDSDTRTELHKFGNTLNTEFRDAYSFYDDIVTINGAPVIYDISKHFLPDVETRDFFLEFYEAVSNTKVPDDLNYYFGEFVHRPYGITHYTVDDVNNMLDVILQHPNFPRTWEEGEAFRSLLWQCYDIQADLKANWSTYYEDWWEKKKGGNWMVEKYADTPPYLTFDKGIVNFYFYIDQSTKEPVPVSYEIRAAFNAAVPNIYMGPVEVEYVNLDADSYDSQLSFFKRWMNGKL